MEDLKDIVLNILALLAILLLVVELIGYSTWNKRYFTFGIPIFVRTIPTNDTTLLPPSVQDMEARCPSSFWGPSIQFREIGQGEYAFRDGQFRFFSLAYPPVMHGYLAYDAHNKQIRVTGFVILIYPLVIFGAISYVLSPGIALIFLGVFFGIPYLLQAARFNAVANMAANFSTATYSQTRNAG